MASPERINQEELADRIAGFFRRAQLANNSVIAVMDDIMPELAQAIMVDDASPAITIFLTQRSTVDLAITARCKCVHLPRSPLPGKIGGFILSGQGASFRLRDSWYSTDADDEIMAELTAIGDRVIRLTGIVEDELE